MVDAEFSRRWSFGGLAFGEVSQQSILREKICAFGTAIVRALKPPRLLFLFDLTNYLDNKQAISADFTMQPHRL